LKAQLLRRAQDLCVESTEMIDTRYDSTFITRLASLFTNTVILVVMTVICQRGFFLI